MIARWLIGVWLVVALSVVASGQAQGALSTDDDGRWTRLDPGPLGRRDVAASVWTGTELIIWSGGRAVLQPGQRPVRGPRVEGAAYNPAKGSWRVIAEGPIPLRAGAAVVWTGDEMLAWGGSTPDSVAPGRVGAAYDPRRDSWRRISPSPLESTMPAAYAWTGFELIVWGSRERAGDVVDGAAYDPARDSWRRIAPSPLILNLASGSWTGREVVIVGSRLDFGNYPLDQAGHQVEPGTGTTHAMAYDPGTDAWRVLSELRLSPQAPFAVAVDETIMAWDYELSAQQLDPDTDAWTPLPDLPLDFEECYPSGQAVGHAALAVLCNQAALFNPDDDAWKPLIPPSARTRDDFFAITSTAWTGGELIFWGTRFNRDRVELWSYQLEPSIVRSETACTNSGTRALVAEFLAAPTLRLIAPSGVFKWFSTRERIDPSASDRSTLRAYLTDRAKRGVTQRLQEFHFNGVQAGHANIDFTLEESATGVTISYPGKGAVHCATGTIMVWSEGGPLAPTQTL